MLSPLRSTPTIPQQYVLTRRQHAVIVTIVNRAVELFRKCVITGAGNRAWSGSRLDRLSVEELLGLLHAFKINHRAARVSILLVPICGRTKATNIEMKTEKP